LNPVKKNSSRITKTLQEQTKELIFDGIEFPVNLKAITEFEKQNPEISINVLGYKDEGKKLIFPLRISNVEDRRYEVNLLFLEGKHNILIKSLSRLLTRQMSNHDGKRHFCLRCLNSFTKKEVLEKNNEYCKNHDCVKIRMPEKGSILKFENFKHSMHVPIVVYADFECLTKPIESCCKPNLEQSYTEQYQKHEPSGFCFYIVCDGKKLEPVLYTKKSANENIGEIFCKTLKNEIDKVWTLEAKPMIMNEEDKVNFETSTNCWICRKNFTEKNKKVRDHCHFTRKCRGAAHQKCNAFFRKPKFVPLFFHDLSGYDAHLFEKIFTQWVKVILTVFQILKRNTSVSQKVLKMKKENSSINFVF